MLTQRCFSIASVGAWLFFGLMGVKGETVEPVACNRPCGYEGFSGRPYGFVKKVPIEKFAYSFFSGVRGQDVFGFGLAGGNPSWCVEVCAFVIEKGQPSDERRAAEGSYPSICPPGRVELAILRLVERLARHRIIGHAGFANRAFPI
jgi:hypothetical protein